MTPNILCIECGAASNHVSLLCEGCRRSTSDEPWQRHQTPADLAYLEWLRQRDAEKGAL
ncbi:MAG TPA: hypothetical protein VGI78_03875 [Acetobacteraceae bacterium]|jgi:hypothetical protein